MRCANASRSSTAHVVWYSLVSRCPVRTRTGGLRSVRPPADPAQLPNRRARAALVAQQAALQSFGCGPEAPPHDVTRRAVRRLDLPLWSTAYSVQERPQLMPSIPRAKVQHPAITNAEIFWAKVSCAFKSMYTLFIALFVFLRAEDVPTPLRGNVAGNSPGDRIAFRGGHPGHVLGHCQLVEEPGRGPKNACPVSLSECSFKGMGYGASCRGPCRRSEQERHTAACHLTGTAC